MKKLYQKIVNWIKGRVQYEEFIYDPEYIDKMTAISMRIDDSYLTGNVKNDLNTIRLARLAKLERQVKK